MIIDSHVHIGDSEKFDRFYSFKTFLKLMEDQKIIKSVVMPNVSNVIKTSDLNSSFFYDFNLLSTSSRKQLIPFMLIDPNDLITFNQIEDYFKIGLKGIKFHPSICQTKVTDEKLYQYIILASFYKLPILIHCGRHHISHISYIIEVAKKFPKCIFIAAHMGGNASDLIEETLNLLSKEKLKNIYLDTSVNKLPFLIEKAVTLIGSNKLLFGSDEPYADVRMSKYCIEISNISKQQKKDILYGNAKKLFKLN